MRLYIGDITKVDTDVIVNASDTDFTPGGGIARWIAERGGSEIFEDAQKYAPGMIGKTYQTHAGNLKAKSVFHIPTINWQDSQKITLPEIHGTVIAAIEKALELGYSSITFPLLATGTLKLDDTEVAKEIVDGIIHMEKEDGNFIGAICVINNDVYKRIANVLPNTIEVVTLPQ